MNDLYPPSPAQPPDGLRATPPHYWARIAGAVSAVALLGGAWLGLVGVMLWPTWRMAEAARYSENIGAYLVAAGFGLFMAAMLVVPLASVKRIKPPDAVEITADTEPDLVQFIHQVAAECGAPLPHRIWLVPTVNAAVMFDVSPLALVFPTRKSLVLGAGLINALTLDELKAVLAHEFGHFAQGSMRVGAWVYVAHQVAEGLITQRTGLDAFISGLSRSDLRFAWIGWGMGIAIGSIRVVTEALFGLVLRFDRALSREMELQADLVAVRVAGSDSIVHALARLHAADEALELAIREVATIMESGHQPEDVFAVQQHLVGRLAAVRHEPGYGETPVRPEPPRPDHRVFDRELVVSPRMYATHPPLAVREDNAKAIYVPSALDPRPAWSLFRDPAATRKQVTLHHLGHVDDKQRPPMALDEVIRRVDERLDHLGFNPKHRGLYLNRSATRYAKSPDDVVPRLPAGEHSREAILARIDAAWSDALGALLKARRDRMTELATLRALRSGELEAPGRRIEFRGRELSPRHLDVVIEEVQIEVDEAERRLNEQDRQIRVAHRLAARALGPEHVTAHEALVAFLHYAEHTRAVLADEQSQLAATWNHVLRDGSLSSSERRVLLDALSQAHNAVAALHAQVPQVQAPEAVFRREPLLTNWSVWMFGAKVNRSNAPQQLDPAWIDKFLPFLRATIERLDITVNIALDALLDTEDAFAAALRDQPVSAADLGAPGNLPTSWPWLLTGDEKAKPIPPSLVDRVMLGIGPFWGPLRTGIASVVVGGVVFGTASLTPDAPTPRVLLANGFDQPLKVSVAGRIWEVPPHAIVNAVVRSRANTIPLRATTESGEVVEERTERAWRGAALWSVARGAAFADMTVSYGKTHAEPSAKLTTWGFGTGTGYAFFGEDPAETQSAAGSRRALTPYGLGRGEFADESPLGALTPELVGPWALAHLRWDRRSKETMVDTEAAVDAGGLAAVSALVLDPTLPASHRYAILQGLRQPDAVALNAALVAQANAHPDDVGAAWLAAFSLPSGDARDAALDALLTHKDDPLVSTRLMRQARAEGKFSDAERIWQHLVVAEPELAATESDLHVHNLFAMGKIPEIIAFAAANPFDPVAVVGAALDPSPESVPAFARESSPFLALRAVGSGQIEKARALLPKFAAEHYAYWMIVLSDGGTDEERRALALTDPATAESNVLLWGVALAHRFQTPNRDGWEARLRAESSIAHRALRWLNSARDDASLREAVAGLDPLRRSDLEEMAVIVAGDAAPTAWKKAAMADSLPGWGPYWADGAPKR